MYLSLYENMEILKNQTMNIYSILFFHISPVGTASIFEGHSPDHPGQGSSRVLPGVCQREVCCVHACVCIYVYFCCVLSGFRQKQATINDYNTFLLTIKC